MKRLIMISIFVALGAAGWAGYWYWQQAHSSANEPQASGKGGKGGAARKGGGPISVTTTTVQRQPMYVPPLAWIVWPVM